LKKHRQSSRTESESSFRRVIREVIALKAARCCLTKIILIGCAEEKQLDEGTGYSW